MNQAQEPADVRLGIVRGISYGLFGKPDEFVPQARGLGAGMVRTYVYWGQVEPEPGRYTFDAVDALLDQLDRAHQRDEADPSAGAGRSAGAEPLEAWITVCSSSPWGTRQSTDFLPPSPAHDLDLYAEFVRRLVRRCRGRVRYWQCDNEPSNTALLWAGTAAEYAAQLRVMYRAVKDADPDAVVVLGGCGYDMLSSPEGSEQRAFYDTVVRLAGDSFDQFDLHLYGDPVRIPEYVQTVRALLREHGLDKPIVVGEYAGPAPFEFPEAEAALYQTMAAAFAADVGTQSTAELAEREARETPERRAMTALYDRMAELPARLQMFLVGCPPELEAKRHRINCRSLVTRNLLALSCGIRRTWYWNLAPEVAAEVDPRQLMHLMFGKFVLMGYEHGTISRRYPAADTFALLSEQLAGATAVHRISVGAPVRAGGEGDVYAFAVDRPGRPPLLVAWRQLDQFDGEDEPPVTIELPWPAEGASAVDAFGVACPVEVRAGRLRLPVSITPVFVGGTAGS